MDEMVLSSTHKNDDWIIGHIVKATRKDTVLLKTAFGKSKCELNDVLFAPELSNNLLCVFKVIQTENNMRYDHAG